MAGCAADLLCRVSFQTKLTGMASASLTHVLYGYMVCCLQLLRLVGETSDGGRLSRGKHTSKDRRIIKTGINLINKSHQVLSLVVWFCSEVRTPCSQGVAVWLINQSW